MHGTTEFMKPRLVHLNKAPYDVYIGRPSKWGNPFSQKEHGSKANVIQLYREWIRTSPLMDDLHELEGKTLACWCHPSPCHGDVLLELLDEARTNRLIEF